MITVVAGEVPAEHLLPGERFRRGGAEWVAEMVAVTHGGPVEVTARQVRDGIVAMAPTVITIPIGEIVRLRGMAAGETDNAR